MKKSNLSRSKIAHKLTKQPESEFYQVDLTEVEHPAWMTRCFRNNRYTVMVWDNCRTTQGAATRAMVQNLSNTRIINHWSEMQKIKNEIFGEETVAVEYYPAQSKLVDNANIYWLWIFPEGVLPGMLE